MTLRAGRMEGISARVRHILERSAAELLMTRHKLTIFHIYQKINTSKSTWNDITFTHTELEEQSLWKSSANRIQRLFIRLSLRKSRWSATRLSTSFISGLLRAIRSIFRINLSMGWVSLAYACEIKRSGRPGNTLLLPIASQSQPKVGSLSVEKQILWSTAKSDPIKREAELVLKPWWILSQSPRASQILPKSIHLTCQS